MHKKNQWLLWMLCSILTIHFGFLSAEDNDLQSKRILVTGGAGFLGSHLCAYLIERGDEVVCMDSLYTGSLSNIKNLLDHPRFTFIKHDITHPILWQGPLDEIFNMACPASPPHYQRDPIHTVRTSVTGATNLLELALEHKAKIFQSSTSEVYGDPLEHPQKESYWGHVNPIGIRACYDEGKRCAETLFFCYHQQFGVRIKVARIFNTYGPNMSLDDGRVVSNFIVQALTNAPITIYGEGQQTRSFCYVSDLIEGIIQLMATEDDVTGPVNLGNDGEFTILELAQEIKMLIGSESELIYEPMPGDDPKQRRPDLDKARTLLGWQPKVRLSDGLKKTIPYFANELALTGTDN